MSGEDRPADGWDMIEQEFDLSAQIANEAIEQGRARERTRCAAAVTGEIERGRLRGVPETAGVMVILHRILSAIQNG